MSLEDEVENLSKKLKMLMFLCLMLGVGCAVLGYLMYGVYQTPTAAEAGAADPTGADIATEVQVGEIYALPPNTVNLLDSQLHYLKLAISLEVPSADVERLRARQALLENEVLAVVRNRTVSQLRGESGQVQLQEELLVRFNQALEGQAIVSRVLFTEFAIQ